MVKQEAEKILQTVRETYLGGSDRNKEAGFPDYQACVFNTREVFREFLAKEEFETLNGRRMNEEFLNFEKVADERRKDFYQEVINFGKFTKAPHKNARFPLIEARKTISERLKEVISVIESQFEDDPEEKCEFMMLVSKISLLKTEAEKEVELERIVSLL